MDRAGITMDAARGLIRSPSRGGLDGRRCCEAELPSRPDNEHDLDVQAGRLRERQVGGIGFVQAYPHMWLPGNPYRWTEGPNSIERQASPNSRRLLGRPHR